MTQFSGALSHGVETPLPEPPAFLAAARACLGNDDRAGLSRYLVAADGAGHRFLHLLGAADAEPPPTDLLAACRRFDADGLEHALLNTAVVGALQPPGTCRFDRVGFWEHSAAVAFISRALARHVGLETRLAFTCGLLHDVGRAVLDIQEPRRFEAALRYRERHDTWIREAELAVLGTDHCLVGAALAERWDLPAPIPEVLRHHHAPDQPWVHSPLSRVVHIADLLARGMQLGNPGDDTLPMLADTVMAELGINWGDIRSLLDEASEMRQPVRTLILNVLTVPG